MAYIREVVVEKALVKETEKRGGIAYKLTVPGRRNVPDRLLLMPGGRAIFVECKAPGERERPAQRRELARLAALGFETHVLASPDCSRIFDPDTSDQLEMWIPDYVVDSGYNRRRRKKDEV